MSHRNAARQGFSLIELVIVVVIIGIIAAIAIPRMSRGTAGAADSALNGNLSVLRNAIELYASEHGGTFPATPETQLVQFTNADGGVSATKTTTHIYGPYLRKIPPVTVGPLKADAAKNNLISVVATDDVDGAPAKGWVYNSVTGSIKANILDAGVDASGKAYNTY